MLSSKPKRTIALLSLLLASSCAEPLAPPCAGPTGRREACLLDGYRTVAAIVMDDPQDDCPERETLCREMARAARETTLQLLPKYARTLREIVEASCKLVPQ